MRYKVQKMKKNEKMKTRILIIILACLSSALVNGQDKADIQHIRSKYKQVKMRIDLSTNSKGKDNFYCAIWENNAYASLLGEHTKTLFWYNDTPDIIEEMGEDPRTCLEMVIDKHRIDDGQVYYKEFLFDNGQLIFIYSKYMNQQKKAQELRLYFKNNTLIKQLGEQGVQIGDKESLINEAEFNMKQFLINLGVK